VLRILGNNRLKTSSDPPISDSLEAIMAKKAKKKAKKM
jgi:hypothetical protein